MKRQVLATVFALSLMGGGSALAQDDHHDDHHGGATGGGNHSGGATGGSGQHAGATGGGAPSGSTGQHTGAPAGVTTSHVVTAPTGSNNHSSGAPSWQHSGGPPSSGGDNHNHFDHGPGPGFGGPQGGGQPNGAHNGGQGWDHRGWGGPGGWNNAQGRGPSRSRYDSRFFPHQINPDRRFHWARPWNPQPNYYYRHWSYGDRLPWGWFGTQWYIDDYYDYDLPAPPWGYEWVRVGPDALLVELNSGVVVETVDGLFY